ncbi:hypothetical protein EDC01DRAFT_635246 [Geopyxis carbonaria]|nr:hypothetical protein EDC01DRAFT_635246 [Geopyxis carbonaria]
MPKPVSFNIKFCHPPVSRQDALLLFLPSLIHRFPPNLSSLIHRFPPILSSSHPPSSFRIPDPILTPSVILNSSVRGCLRRQSYSIRRSGAAYTVSHTQDAPVGVNLHPSSPPTLQPLRSSPPTIRLRGRVVESATLQPLRSSLPTIRLRGRVVESATLQPLRSSPPTIRLRGRVVESAYPTAVEIESAYPTPSRPSRRVRLRCQHSIHTQDAPVGVNLHPSSPPTLQPLRSSPPTLRRRGRVVESAYAVSTLFILKMHPSVSTCTRRVRLPYVVEAESSSPPTLRRRVRVGLPYSR